MSLFEERQKRIKDLGFDYDSQPKKTVPCCNLCGEKRFVVLAHHDRYRFPAQAHGCLKCGLVFLNPVMTQEAYQDFYSSTYRPLVSAYHGRRIDAQTIRTEQQVYASERADLLSAYISPSSGFTSLLDIGGSTGVVAHHMSRCFGLKATVLDPSPMEIEHARQLSIETIPGLLEEYEPDGNGYDLVLMCQTVDHLQDVAGAMHKVRDILNDNGLFFIDIVDFRAAYLRNWSIEEAIKIDHPFYLTEATMTAFLLRAGFEVLRMDYAADHLHVSYVCRVSQPQHGYLPSNRPVENLWYEIRKVQNASRVL
ncbi:MAG TPA: class I SAM-dependent methyltransferase [Candidatus Methylomirabilis sp.]|nr:class I SAM-dependent methyltransferase [Candidatus Methylomirabilis sp.]